MSQELTIEQRFALSRARYEVERMSRNALEKTALRLLRSRMEQKNGVQSTLQQNGIMFKIEEHATGIPEIISEQFFMDMLTLNVEEEDEIPQDIHDEGYENDDLDDDGLSFA